MILFRKSSGQEVDISVARVENEEPILSKEAEHEIFAHGFSSMQF